MYVTSTNSVVSLSTIVKAAAAAISYDELVYFAGRGAAGCELA